MRVYWGDGTNSAYEQGVTPSHTYPYPGQYRIQIEADDGFDAARLGGGISSVIRGVDQWAPQFRVGASGTGFTGEGINALLKSQLTLEVIPPFKYTDLTDTRAAFESCKRVIGDTVDWVPTNLQKAQKIGKMFYNCWQSTSDSSALANFPTLQTSDDLVSMTYLFTNTRIRSFQNDTPLTNTSSVTSFSNAFRNCSLTNIILDTSNATDLQSAFAENSFVSFPSLITNNVENFSGTWQDCSSLTSFPQINTSSGTNFTSAWQGCSNLTSFPSLDFGNAIEMQDTFRYCSSLTTPPITAFASSVTTVSTIYDQCSLLSGTHTFSGAGITSMIAFARATGLTEVTLNTPSNTTLYYAFFECPSLTTINFSNASTANVSDLTYAFYQSTNNVLLNFPSDMKFPSLRAAGNAWRNNQITDFPANAFDTTNTLDSDAFKNTWLGCALTAQAIENILVSLDTNGQSNIELGIDGGTNAAKSTWTAAANTAYTNLINKGWTITFNP